MTQNQMNVLKSLITKHEGLNLNLYKCPSNKWTIGYGRNIEDNGISEAEAEYFLDNDIERCMNEAKRFPWFSKLNDARQIVILSMLFNLGHSRFLGFKLFLAALAIGDFAKAANEMLASVWASQLGKRAVELATIMKTGIII